MRLATTQTREGPLDGAWWPRSRDAGDELPRPIAALAEHPGPVARVGLDAGAWGELPTRLTVDAQVVHVDSFPAGDDTVLVTRGDRDHFSLLVIPPHATPEAARAATARAVRAGNVTRAERILIDTGTHRARPVPTEGLRTVREPRESCEPREPRDPANAANAAKSEEAANGEEAVSLGA